MTYATEIAERAATPVLYVEVEGWGPYWHGGDGEPYKFTTHQTGRGARWLPLLSRLPASLSESINPRDGATSIGSQTFHLLDGQNDDATNSGIITDLLATHAENIAGCSWGLAANITAAAVAPFTFTVSSSAGLAAFAAAIAAGTADVVWIGREAFRISAVNIGLLQFTVSARAIYGTTAEAHTMVTGGGDGQVKDHPHFIRDRKVWLKHTFRDAAGAMLAVGEDVTVWMGYVTDWSMDRPTEFQITARAALSALDAEVGKTAFSATVSADGQPPVEVMRAQTADYYVEVTPQTGPGATWYATERTGDYTHVRVGNQIMEAEVAGDATTPARAILPSVYGVLDTPIEEIKVKQIVREILIVDNDPRWYANLTPLFVSATGTLYQHPLEVALCVLTSSGTAGGNGVWDVLPAKWGLNLRAVEPIPVPDTNDIDIDNWRGMIAATTGLSMANLIIGWEGPVKVKAWLEANILKPLGMYLYLNEDGQLAVGRLGDVYPRTVPTAMTEADILPGSESVEGNQDALIAWTIYRWAKLPHEDEHAYEYRYRHQKAQERHRNLGDTVEINADGFRGNDGSPPSVVALHAAVIDRLFALPLPVIRVSTALHLTRLSLTEPVALTSAAIPNPWTGTRGLTAQNAAVVKREFRWAKGEIDWTLVLLPDEKVGYWAPSAVVTAYAAGPPVVVTVQQNAFTDGNAAGAIPANDVEAFAADPATGDRVALYNSDGVARSSTAAVAAPRVTARVVGPPSTLTLDVAFADAAGAPVVPVAGDIITFPRYGAASTSPAVAWTASMDDSVAQADRANLNLGATADVPYVYGI